MHELRTCYITTMQCSRSGGERSSIAANIGISTEFWSNSRALQGTCPYCAVTWEAPDICIINIYHTVPEKSWKYWWLHRVSRYEKWFYWRRMRSRTGSAEGFLIVIWRHSQCLWSQGDIVVVCAGVSSWPRSFQQTYSEPITKNGLNWNFWGLRSVLGLSAGHF